ncbi:helix-turn-helix transcriptional regulator, partial [Actinokineospora sp.]|uniref:helix-turn-helix transcriptional regulator n=1 Tax=Actinokineospora sp. TaxID=1872133 RepID=UPI0040381D2A
GRVAGAGWPTPAGRRGGTRAAWVRPRLGDTEAALRLAETEQELALAWGAPATVGRVLRVRGTLTPGPAGLRLLREALDVLDDSENQLERARVHLLLGGRLPQADAEPHLRRGRALVEVCAARWLAERELGAIANPTGLPDPPAGGSLTRAERRVVELAVTGRTNQAIADELGVGSRVVEKHLTSAYRKLSVAGRPQLRDAWQAATVSRR